MRVYEVSPLCSNNDNDNDNNSTTETTRTRIIGLPRWPRHRREYHLIAAFGALKRVLITACLYEFRPSLGDKSRDRLTFALMMDGRRLERFLEYAKLVRRS